jgi:phage tail-like protein
MSQNAISRYHFTVEWGGSRIGFTEVSGLDIEIEAVSYREGSNPQDHVNKIPGMRKFSDITLKRGIVRGDNDFFKWINTKEIDNIERRDLTISLLDGQHQPVVVWKVNNAFPVKYEGPTLVAQSSELAIETLVITHEGIRVETF